MASTTLDASAKIYAGRVDAIHAETYKVLSGLGRGSDKQKQTQGKYFLGIVPDVQSGSNNSSCPLIC